MSNEVDCFGLSSEDSDDIALNRSARLGAECKAQDAGSGEDPDWVRSFTPAKRESERGSDSDSLINLISDEDDLTGTTMADDTTTVRTEKTGGKTRVSTRPRNQLPLVAAPKLDDALSLLQAEDNELDLSGDVGAVGRVKIDGGNVVLDIKGTLYRATPYASNSMCVVTLGDQEAKITAVMNHAVVLRAERNLFAADDGVLDGHVFDHGAADDTVAVEDGVAVERGKDEKGSKGRAPRKSITKGRTKTKNSGRQGKSKKK